MRSPPAKRCATVGNRRSTPSVIGSSRCEARKREEARTGRPKAPAKVIDLMEALKRSLARQKGEA
jgi:non-homologous end joining protein Ku